MFSSASLSRRSPRWHTLDVRAALLLLLVLTGCYATHDMDPLARLDVDPGDDIKVVLSDSSRISGDIIAVTPDSLVVATSGADRIAVRRRAVIQAASGAGQPWPTQIVTHRLHPRRGESVQLRLTDGSAVSGPVIEATDFVVSVQQSPSVLRAVPVDSIHSGSIRMANEELLTTPLKVAVGLGVLFALAYIVVAIGGLNW